VTAPLALLSRALERAALAYAPTAEAAARVAAFLELRARWARTHDLSGPGSLDDPWAIDVVDGVAVALAASAELPLVDVGAGSGVPGLVVACLDPTRPVVVVEPRTKRAAFLRTAAQTLELAGVRVERARWPITLDQPVAVVSRAVVDPAEWPDLALSGGAHVVQLLRMLAARRPTFQRVGWQMDRPVDYRGADGHPRAIERYVRVDRPA
jgi:16S rRNA G527 N7-methylase RsmG